MVEVEGGVERGVEAEQEWDLAERRLRELVKREGDFVRFQGVFHHVDLRILEKNKQPNL